MSQESYPIFTAILMMILQTVLLWIYVTDEGNFTSEKQSNLPKITGLWLEEKESKSKEIKHTNIQLLYSPKMKRVIWHKANIKDFPMKVSNVS